MKIAFPSRDFDDAVANVCHGLVSNEQARALNELLRENPAARDEYILRLELQSRLASQLDLFAPTAEPTSGTNPGGVISFSNRGRNRSAPHHARRRTMIWAGGLAAALVVLAAAGWMWRFGRPAPNHEQPRVAAVEDDWKPSSANLPGHEYPRINSERRAQFRIEAPEAKYVAVTIGDPLTVAKSEDGAWIVTTAPLAIGFHFYELVIDGESVPDPATPIFRGGGGDGYSSGVEVPTGEDFHEWKHVPHGEVREERYFSRTTQDWRRIFVYTPPHYHRDASARFPVLYLLPGMGEDESCWSAQGRLAQILDNLIAEGKAVPMLAVMEGGVARRPGEPDTTWQPPADLRLRFITLDQTITDDLIPMIDRNYRTIADARNRALAGLSLGGAQAFAIGLRNPDVFANIGGFSGVGGGPGRSFDPKAAYGALMTDVAAFNDKMGVLFLSIGQDEPDWLATSVKSYRETLQALGVDHVFLESPDTGHEWHTWRRSLREFAQLLFKEPVTPR